MREMIPFNRPFFAGNEQRYIAESIQKGQISGNGYFTKRCEEILAEILAAQRVMLTTSCTDALEMSALLLQLRQGDEIIMPSYTFVSTANAFVIHGGTPVFVDIRPDTLNLDERQLEAAITERTRAIVPVHYGGTSCEMDVINELAASKGICVIEDNAHGLFGKYKDRPLGSLGSLATQSFHETKNLTCGEGGALVINDSKFSDRAEILRDKGTNRGRFVRGDVDKYTWVDCGSSFLPSDLLAAFLLAQLEESDRIQGHRKQVWERYRAELGLWAEEHSVALPFVPPHCITAYHVFFLVMSSRAVRDAFIDHMRKEGVLAVSHYEPLHLSEFGAKYGYSEGSLPISESMSGRVVRLPLFNDLDVDEQGRVIDAVLSFETF